MSRPRGTLRARRFVVVALALVLAVVAATLLATQIPTVRAYILREVESRLTHYAGREIRIERADFRPLRSELELHSVQVARGSGPADDVLLAVDTIRLGWGWRPLLRRSLVLDQILLVRPRLTLRRAAVPVTPFAARAMLKGDLIEQL